MADDDWELCPENGHPAARKLLRDDFYWDCVDDNSPLGNDTGADVLAFYREALESDPNVDPIKFLSKMLDSWGMPFDHWTLSDSEQIAEFLKTDPYTIPSADDAVIGLAFGMFVLQGYVNRQVREMATAAIKREALGITIQSRGWISPEERYYRLEDMASTLGQMPTKS